MNTNRELVGGDKEVRAVVPATFLISAMMCVYAYQVYTLRYITHGGGDIHMKGGLKCQLSLIKSRMHTNSDFLYVLDHTLTVT